MRLTTPWSVSHCSAKPRSATLLVQRFDLSQQRADSSVGFLAQHGDGAIINSHLPDRQRGRQFRDFGLQRVARRGRRSQRILTRHHSRTGSGKRRWGRCSGRQQGIRGGAAIGCPGSVNAALRRVQGLLSGPDIASRAVGYTVQPR